MDRTRDLLAPYATGPARWLKPACQRFGPSLGRIADDVGRELNDILEHPSLRRWLQKRF